MYSSCLPTFYSLCVSCTRHPIHLLLTHLPQVLLLILSAVVANYPASWMLTVLCLVLPFVPNSVVFLVLNFTFIVFLYLSLLEQFLVTTYKEMHLVLIGLFTCSFLCVSLLEKLCRTFLLFPAHEKDQYDDAELAPTLEEKEEEPKLLFHRYWIILLFGLRLLTTCLAYVYVFYPVKILYLKISILTLLLITGGINAAMDDICGVYFFTNKRAVLLISELLLVLMIFEGSLLENIKICMDIPPSHWKAVPCSIYSQLASF